MAMVDVLQLSPMDRLREAYADWSESKGRSVDQWMELLGDEIEMRSILSPDLPDDLAAHRVSKAAALEYFSTLSRDWEMISFDCDRFIADKDDVVMVGRCAWRNRATGKIVDTPKVDIWHFENGRAVTFMEMFDSLAFMRAIPFGDAMGVE